MTFKGFIDSKRLLDRSQYFNILVGKKYQPYYQDLGKIHLIMVSSYQQKLDNAMNVKMKYFV